VTLALLTARLEVLLPDDYQATYDTLEAKPMRSAGLKYGRDGRVAWDDIWGSFCDLAMAGGPPHKGALLGPGSPADIAARPTLTADAEMEICRGINITTDFVAEPAPDPGWVRVICTDEAMAGWLLRAITPENVAVRGDGLALELPAGPGYRLDKEIKNVITVIAKTFHYWNGHMSRERQRQIGEPLVTMERECGLIAPVDGWRGVACADVSTALWTMRLLLASNVLARREGTTVFVPVNQHQDPGGRIAEAAVERVRPWARELSLRV
jgi:sirohydrochlorin cobaltochelatase